MVTILTRTEAETFAHGKYNHPVDWYLDDNDAQPSHQAFSFDVKFRQAFSAPPQLHATLLGLNSDPAPTAMVQAKIEVKNITSSGCSFVISRPSPAIKAERVWGTWIAIGP